VPAGALPPLPVVPAEPPEPPEPVELLLLPHPFAVSMARPPESKAINRGLRARIVSKDSFSAELILLM
jgi:hypothetical protein